MTTDLLTLLACPHCRGILDIADVSGRDPTSGRWLRCKANCGDYPIVDGVPRLLPEMASSHTASADRQNPTGRAFSAQWRLHQGNTTWGVTVEERVPVVLHELGWSERDLPGKTILDAGCGNGSLSFALAERGATVVALDLSESVFDANEQYSHPNLHFIQGNLFFPPLRSAAFDAVYSCGVFHHTPSTRRCFDAVAPLLKEDADTRYFVWLYARRSTLFNFTVEPLMRIARRMPSWMLIPACHALSPPVEAGTRLCTRLGLSEDAPRSLRDRAVQLHDLLSPPFVWYHTFDEARGWAKERGFDDIRQTQYTVASDRTTGNTSILEKYRRICRPGFGMLCRWSSGSQVAKP